MKGDGFGNSLHSNRSSALIFVFQCSPLLKCYNALLCQQEGEPLYIYYSFHFVSYIKIPVFITGFLAQSVPTSRQETLVANLSNFSITVLHGFNLFFSFLSKLEAVLARRSHLYRGGSILSPFFVGLKKSVVKAFSFPLPHIILVLCLVNCCMFWGVGEE